MQKKDSTVLLLHANSTGTPVIAAEIAAAGDGSYALLQTSASHDIDALKSKLKQSGADITFMQDAPHTDGSHVLVVRSAHSPDGLMNALNNAGCNLSNPDPEKKAFNPWKWRGLSSLTGQSLQLVSGFTSGGSKSDTQAILGFAFLNLIASGCNIAFGSQHNTDAHRLSYIKDQVNVAFTPYVEDPNSLPSVKGNALETRQNELKELSFGEQVYDTVRHVSVSFGEGALRTLGSMSLVFPITRLGEAFTQARQGNFVEAFNAARNPNDVSFQAGLMMLTGKFATLIAKEPDPYNPEPSSALDHFRGHVAFKLSSVVETAASTYMLLDRLNVVGAADFHPKIMGKTLDRDYAGALGHTVFNLGYVARFVAPYGSLDVDMQHVYAYVSDAMQQIPKEEVPNMLLAVSKGLSEHFADRKISMVEIYAGIAEDLRRHYQMDVAQLSDGAATTSDIPDITIRNAQRQGVAVVHTPQHATVH